MKKRNSVPFTMLIIWLVNILATCLCLYFYINVGAVYICYAAIVFGSVAAHFLIMYISAPIVFLVFQKKYKYDSFWFRQKGFEKKLYKSLRVKEWKTKLPAYNSKEYSLQCNDMETIIYNMCHAEVVHEVIMLASYLPVLFGKIFSNYWLIIALSFVFSCTHLSFVIIQRYNRPRIIRIYEKTKQAL